MDLEPPGSFERDPPSIYMYTVGEHGPRTTRIVWKGIHLNLYCREHGPIEPPGSDRLKGSILPRVNTRIV